MLWLLLVFFWNSCQTEQINQESIMPENCSLTDNVNLMCKSPAPTLFHDLKGADFIQNITDLIITDAVNLLTLHCTDVQNMTSLQRLTITNSSLSSLSSDTVKCMPRIETLDFRSNAFSTIHWQWFRSAPKSFKQLYLSANPLKCGCDLLWLKNYVQIHEHLDVIYSFPDTLVDYSDITCYDNATNEYKLISNLSKESCPKVTVRWRKLSGTHELRLGDDVTLSCAVTCVDVASNKDRTLQRRESCKDIEHTFTSEIVKHRPNANDNIGILEGSERLVRITNASANDMALYWCRLPNASYPFESSLTLLVYSAPRFLGKLKALDHSSLHGYKFSLDAHPLPHINQTELLDDNRKAISTDWYYIRVSKHPNFEWLHIYALFLRNHHMHQIVQRYFILTACNEIGCAEQRFFWELVDIGIGTEKNPAIYRPFYNVSSPKDLDGLQASPNTNSSSLNWRQVLIASLVSFIVLFLATALVWIVMLVQRNRKRKRDETYLNFKLNEARSLLSSLATTPADPDERPPIAQMFAMRTLAESSLTDSFGRGGGNGTNTALFRAEIPVIPIEQLSLEREIGEGAFGKVYLAYWANFDGTAGPSPIQVAAKAMKTATIEQLVEFEREASLITHLDHPSIVKFYGVSVNPRAGNILLLFEYMNQGDLRSYLMEHGPHADTIGMAYSPLLELADLFHISQQVAAGMAYLSRKGLVHRDLAARNCLVRVNCELNGDICSGDLCVKVGDFGMTRKMYSENYYKVKQDAMLPVRWLPPESLKLGKFTSESDVWSFGVLLWEIFSFGTLPYYELSNQEVVTKVAHGLRLPRPAACPPEVYMLMTSCWENRPAQRVTMKVLCDKLGHMKAVLERESSNFKNFLLSHSNPLYDITGVGVT